MVGACVPIRGFIDGGPKRRKGTSLGRLVTQQLVPHCRMVYPDLRRESADLGPLTHAAAFSEPSSNKRRAAGISGGSSKLTRPADTTAIVCNVRAMSRKS